LAQDLTLGINYGLVLGSKNDVCINPIGLWSPQAWAPFIGGGLGGKLDFLIGSKTELVWGPSLSIELSAGEEALKLKRQAKAVPMVRELSILLGLVSAVWVVAHSLMGEDCDRAALGGATQAFSFCLLTMIMLYGKHYQEVFEIAADEAIRKANAAYLKEELKKRFPRYEEEE
jgi:hypothetical protein